MSAALTTDTTCLPRLEWAGALVDRGDWASGHAIAAGLLTCARQTKCPRRAVCAGAVESLICDIRRLLDN